MSDLFIEQLPWQLTTAKLQKGYDSENSQDFVWLVSIDMVIETSLAFLI